MFENAENPYVPGVDYPLTDADVIPALYDFRLAAALGDDREALFLQQVLRYIAEAEYEKKATQAEDGLVWVEISTARLARRFSYWSYNLFCRTRNSLKRKGILRVHRARRADGNRGVWYAVDAAKLQEYGFKIDPMFG